jgi:hypothetical protein
MDDGPEPAQMGKIGDMCVKTGGSDRRKTHRLGCHLEVNFSDGRSLFKEVIHDLSTGGLQAEAPRHLDVGTELTLSIVADPPVKVKGVVRWTMKKGIKYRGLECSSQTSPPSRRSV